MMSEPHPLPPLLHFGFWIADFGFSMKLEIAALSIRDYSSIKSYSGMFVKRKMKNFSRKDAENGRNRQARQERQEGVTTKRGGAARR
jgi:hypothetical protein